MDFVQNFMIEHPIGWLCFLFVISCVNGAFFYFGRGRMRWFSLIGGAVPFAAFLLAMWMRIGSGCGFDPYPEVVEFHQGMTLCPGQTARVNLELR